MAVAVVLVVLSLGWSCQAALHQPKVSVYTTNPMEEGKDNTLVCLCQGFHPPDITMELLKNGELIEDVKAQDMSFESDWDYKWMKYHPFTNKQGDEYKCRVKHANSESKDYKLDPMLL